jgi:hypothetical protein
MLMELGTPVTLLPFSSPLHRFLRSMLHYSPNSTKFNEFSWNTRANLLVLDQPVGVGFSYADHGETVVRVLTSPMAQHQ